jgi:23S rRNA (cytidine1920-2'-O)/16S rRNA (cytidine1409-2'-O)-methyltransferase
MGKSRLDQELVRRGLTTTRSQAESYTKLGYVKVNGKEEHKPGFLVNEQSRIQLTIKEQYVSRAALKLASVYNQLQLNFKNKIVLDVGSSTGGFTDFALRHGAQKVIAVDVGSEQLHPSLRSNAKVELHEKTDIRSLKRLDDTPAIVVIDVSFVSLREILPAVAKLAGKAQVVAMVKPQFETGGGNMHKGVVKNSNLRRKIFRDFEDWAKNSFKIIAKADSLVAGSQGNVEKFYLLHPLQK